MTPKICHHCQRVHPPHLLRCPETRALLDFEGRTLQGRYLFVRSIGQSAHARVWEAEHLGTGRKVVVKTLRPEYLDDLALITRFEQEAALGGRVHSDHVVPIFDQGHSEAGPFLVMDWAPGEPLDARLIQDHAQGGPWPLPMVLRWAQCVASGLMAIHQAGVVHRDLKPSNMLVHGYGEALGVKILDFGVAKSLCQMGHTAAGVLLGTQAYMPPEQRQNAANVDERADLYAFGVILDQLLRGLDQPNSDAAALRELDDMPPAWRALHASLLATDPQARPPSARALHHELCKISRMGDGELAGISKPGFKSKFRTSPRTRSRTWEGVVAGLALGGCLGWMASSLAPWGTSPVSADRPPMRPPLASASVGLPFADRLIGQSRPLLAPPEPGGQCLALEAPVPSPVRKSRARKKRRSPVVKTASGSSGAKGAPLQPDLAVLPKLSDASVLRRSDAVVPHRGTQIRPSKGRGSGSGSAAQLEVGGLRALGGRISPMGFFDARQYCQTLARAGHQGLDSWRLALPDEVARWVDVKGIRTGWYWTDALDAGRAQVVALPSKRRFKARVRRRFIRPFCVAPVARRGSALERGQANSKMIER